MKLSELPDNEQAYHRHCSRTGAYVDPHQLSAQLRERVDAQVLRQRPIDGGQEHYYLADVIAELEPPILDGPPLPFRVPPDKEMEGELALAMLQLLRMEAAIRGGDSSDDQS